MRSTDQPIPIPRTSFARGGPRDLNRVATIEETIDATRRWIASHDWDEGLDERLHRLAVPTGPGRERELELLALLHEGVHLLSDHYQAPSPVHRPSEGARREVAAERGAVQCARLLGHDLSTLGAEYLSAYQGVMPDAQALRVVRELTHFIEQSLDQPPRA